MGRRPSGMIGLSISALLIVLFGFSFTYWGPVLRGGTFSPLIHVHALLWFGWFFLFLAQAVLVRRRRFSVHRKIGQFGSAYTAALIGVSLWLALTTVARDVHLISGEIESVPTIIPLTQIVMFSTFFFLALANRKTPDRHGRLIVLAALAGMTPSFARMSIGMLGAPNVPLIFAVSTGAIVAVVFLDRRKSRRLHPVYLWGGLVVIVVRVVRVPLAMSPAWKWTATQIESLLSR